MKTKNFYLFIFGMIFLAGVVSASYTNQTDGFSTLAAGAGNSRTITTNGSDFWIIDIIDVFVYHFNSTGGNYTIAGPISSVNAIGVPGFSPSGVGASNPVGVTTNNSDFWVADTSDKFVYHFNSTGGNYTIAGPISSVNAIGQPGFSTTAAGLGAIRGITTNNSDLWVADTTDNFIYHFDRAGNNCTGVSCEAGFSTTAAGLIGLVGVTTNNSDLWAVSGAVASPFVYHFDRNGNNQTDGFSPVFAGAGNPAGIATNVSSGKKPTNFWILDGSDFFIYHFASSCICPVGTNQNWEIDMSEFCVINSNCNLGTGRLNFTGSGNATFSTIINTTDMGLPPAGATVFITSTGRINVY